MHISATHWTFHFESKTRNMQETMYYHFAEMLLQVHFFFPMILGWFKTIVLEQGLHILVASPSLLTYNRMQIKCAKS